MTQHGLQLNGSVVIGSTVDEVYDKLGQSLIDAAKGAITQRGEFHLALSGGSTPKKFSAITLLRAGRARASRGL